MRMILNKNMNKYLFLVATFLIASNQQTSIVGTVYDELGNPIENVEVTVTNSSNGTVTDNRGIYLIEFDKESPPDSLYFSHIGFKQTSYSLQNIIDNGSNVILSQSSISNNQIFITSLRNNIHIKESPVLTHIIDENEIKFTGASNTRELIEIAIPNVQIVHDNHGNNGIKIQGYNSNNIAFLIDGFRVYAEFAGNIDFSMLDSEDIDRVEVIRGGMSTLYGSGAIGGVINLITKKRRNSVWARLKILNDAPLITSKQFSLGYSNNNFQYNLSLNEDHSDGYDLTPSLGVGNIDKTLEVYSAFSAAHKLIYNFNSDNILSLRYSSYAKDISKYALNLGVSLDENLNVIEDSSIVLQREVPSYKDQIVSIDYKKNINENSNLSISYYNEKYVKIYTYPYYYGDFPHNPDSESFEWSIPKTQNVNAIFNTKINSHLILIGSEYINREYLSRDIHSNGNPNEENINENSIFGSDTLKKCSEGALFISDAFNINSAAINLGVRFNYNTAYGYNILPSFALKQRVYNQILRFNFSHNFRSPSLKELYYEMEQHSPSIYGNVNLKPQASNHYSLSVESVKRINSSFEIYASQNYNMINYRSITEIDLTTSDTTSYLISDNYSDILLYGINYNNYIDFSKKSSVKGIYSYTSANSKSNDTLDGISKHAIKIQIHHQFNNKLRLSLSTKYCSNKYWEEILLDAYTISDLLFTWEGNNNIFFKFGIKNIFDYIDRRSESEISDILTSYDPGRRFFMQITLNFKKDLK